MRALAAGLLVLCCMVRPGSAYGQSLQDHFAPGSIDSVDRANAALAAAAQERTKSDADFAVGKQTCYQKFLANACIDQLSADHRAREAEIRAVEVEAKRFKRSTHDAEIKAERSKKAQTAAQQAQADAALREQNRAAFAQKQADAKSAAQKKQARTAEDSAHVADYQSKIQGAGQEKAKTDAQANAILTKSERDERDLAKKRQDAADRKERLAKKHQEKEAERAEKAQEEAKKDAGLPPAPVGKVPDVPPY